MTRSLKLVPNGAGAETAAEPVTMAEAVADLVATILAQNPVSFNVQWELPGEPELHTASLPGSLALQQGVAVKLYRLHYPWEFESAED